MNYREQLVAELHFLETRKDKLWNRYFNKPTCSGQKQVLKVITSLNDKYNLIYHKLYGGKRNANL